MLFHVFLCKTAKLLEPSGGENTQIHVETSEWYICVERTISYCFLAVFIYFGLCAHGVGCEGAESVWDYALATLILHKWYFNMKVFWDSKFGISKSFPRWWEEEHTNWWHHFLFLVFSTRLPLWW